MNLGIRTKDELSHVTSLLSTRLSSVEELKQRLRKKTSELNKCKKKKQYETARANALEVRLEEIAQLLQIVTQDRDNLRTDVVGKTETIKIQTQERVEQNLKHDLDLSEKRKKINQLQEDVNKQKHMCNQLEQELQAERASSSQELQAERATSALLLRTTELQAIELNKVKQQLADALGRAEKTENKIESILSIIKQ
jgi:chromosome segregation ATPase